MKKFIKNKSTYMAVFLSLLWCVSHAQFPSITSFSPTSFSEGTIVTINGSNFNPVISQSKVTFGNYVETEGTIITATSTEIKAIVPAGFILGSGQIWVHNLATGGFGVASNFYTGFSAKGEFATGTTLSHGNFYKIDQTAQADFDGDGLKDIATIEESNKSLTIYKNTTSGNTFSAAIEKLYGGITSTYIELTTEDVDGDGKPDIILAQDKHLFIYRNSSTGAGNFAFVFQGFYNLFNSNINNTWARNLIQFADIDGDSKKDLIIPQVVSGTGHLSIFRNTSTVGNLSFDSGVNYNVNTYSDIGAEYQILELNGDNKVDILLKDFNLIKAFRNESTPGSISLVNDYSYTITNSSYFFPYGPMADFNGDGKGDFVLMARINDKINLISYRNTTSGNVITFTEQASQVLPQSNNSSDDLFLNSASSTVVEVHNDGKLDFIIDKTSYVNGPNSGIALYKNISSPELIKFEFGQVLFSGIVHNSLNKVSFNDVTGDGINDFISTNKTSHTFQVLPAKPVQTLNITDLQKTVSDSDFTLPAQSDEGIDVIYYSSNLGVISVSGNTFTINGSGSTVIGAVNNGDVNFQRLSKSITVSVTANILTITANDITREFGASTPAYSFSYSGFIDGDDESSLDVLPTATASGSTVGSHTITPSGAIDPKYDFVYVNGNLTIVKGNPVITWNNPLNRLHGDSLKAFEIQYDFEGNPFNVPRELTASTTIPGTFTYNPVEGTVLDAGTHQLNVSFVPDDQVGYNNANASVSFVIDPIEVPQNIQGNVVSNDSAVVSFDITSQHGTVTYDIERSISSGSGFNIIQSGGAILYNGGLEAGATYYYRARARNKGAYSAYTPEIALTTQLNNVSTVSATRVSTNQINLVWNDINYETNYVIFKKAQGEANFQVLDTVNADITTYSDTNALEGENHYRISAFNANSSSVFDSSFPDSGFFINTPSDLTATAVSANVIQVSWTDNSSLEGNYTLQRSTDAGFASNVSTFSENEGLEVNVTSFTDNFTFQENTIYYYRVRAEASEEFSSYSNVFGLGINKSIPIITWNNPADLVHGSPLSTTQLNATANAAGTFTYNPTEGTLLGVGSHTLNVNFDPTDPNSYFGQSAQVTLNVIDVPAPTNFSLASKTANRVNLSWNDVNGESGYVIERSATSGAGFSVIANLAADITSYADNSVTPITTYYYRIKAVNNSASSSYASEVSVTTPTLAPNNFVVNLVSSSQVDLSWNDVTDETSYSIERSVGDNTSYTSLNSPAADAISYTDNNVSGGNTYFYRISANSAGGASGYAEVSVFVKSTPVITWNNPSNIPTGTPLGQNQLNASANVHGSFTYSPAAGTVLAAGSHTLSADFTPADNSLYFPVNGTTVSITVDGIAAPANFAANAVGSNQINLSWDDVAVNTGYVIERSTTSGSGFTVISNRPDNSVFFADNTVSTSTTYYYRIKSVYNGASSEYSSEVSAATIPSTPANLVASLISDSQIDLSWNDVSGETSYTIQRSVDNNSSFSDLNAPAANATAYSDNTTAAGNTYFYRIRANNAAGASQYSSEVVMQTSCGMPSNTSSSAVGDNSVTINWNAVAGANGYEIVYGLVGANLNSVTAGANDSNITINGLHSGSNYQFRVRTICTDNALFSGFSAFQYFSTTGAAACAAPTGTSVSAITATTATFNWTEPSGATSYEIQYGVHGSSTLNVISVNAGNTAANLTGLFMGTNYQIRIRTICTAGQLFSQWSDFSYFSTIGAAACNMSTATSVSGIGNTSANFNWTETSGAASYEIQYGVHGSSTLHVITANAGTSNISLTGLFNGTNYQVRIRAICTAGQLHSQWSDFSYFSTTGAAACNIPTGTNITGITDNTATFNWTEPSGASSYEIVYGVLGSGLNDLTANVGTSSVNLTGLFSGTTYQVRIRTICTSGQLHSQYTSFVYFTTTGAEACSFPANLNTTGIGAAQVTANWNVVAGADSYHIVYGVVGGGLNDQYVLGGGSVNADISGLAASSNYRWRMRTICNTGQLQSAWSDWDYFTTSASSSIIMDNETNARIKSFRNDQLNVYPNPSNGYVNITMNQLEDEKMQLLIYNAVGKLVYTSMHEQSLQQKVNLKEFGTGLYLIKVNAKNDSQVKRVIIK